VTDDSRPSIQDLTGGAEKITLPEETPEQIELSWREQQEKERNEVELEELKQNLRERKKYAFWLFVALCFWLLAILGILVLQGFSVCGFTLSEPVIIAALGTTTINVIGLFFVVVKYIFPSP